MYDHNKNITLGYILMYLWLDHLFRVLCSQLTVTESL